MNELAKQAVKKKNIYIIKLLKLEGNGFAWKEMNKEWHWDQEIMERAENRTQ